MSASVPASAGTASNRSKILRVLDDAQARADGALGVVLVGGRHAEHPATASPMNFSTTPPNASICLRAIAKWSASIVSTSSGSAVSEMAVKPTRSQNMAVMTFRSSARVEGRRLEARRTRRRTSAHDLAETPGFEPGRDG